MELSSLGEFGLINMIRDSFQVPKDVLGIGDDCAIIPQHDGVETLISTDMLVEDCHFLRNDISAYCLGWKSAAVNISDIAAMGGKPRGSFLSFSLPRTLDQAWIREFIRGYKDISDKYASPLLGGDTTYSPDRICINVTVIGECKYGRSKKRSDARDGDLICVTGPLGDSATGLRLILKGCERDADMEYLVGRHHLPLPRVREGLILSECEGVHAMMDISDGIGSDLQHILTASAKGALIDLSSLPLSAQMQRVCKSLDWDTSDLAICGGEDYELLFTISEQAERELGIEHHIIGKITTDPKVIWVGGKETYCGYRHF